MEVINQAVDSCLISFLEKSLIEEGSNLPAKKEKEKSLARGRVFDLWPISSRQSRSVGSNLGRISSGISFISKWHSFTLLEAYACNCQLLQSLKCIMENLSYLILFNHVSLIPLLISLFRLKSYHFRRNTVLLYGSWFVSDPPKFQD